LPKHKIKREEEISTENWLEILALAESMDYKNAWQTPKFCFWLSCVLAVDWLTGKRINEILRLRRKDVVLDFVKGEIRIRFHVGKKRTRGEPIKMQPYQKTRTLEHKAVPFIRKYLDEFDAVTKSGEAYLFSTNTPSRIRKVRVSFINGKGERETREYSYTDEGGYVYEETARYWLSKINSQLPKSKRIYFHYGRHSMGIKLAYQGRSDIEIAKVLDETPRAALEYTKHAASIGKDWEREIE
jgi:integrase